jgi:hypothetical protein
LRRAGNVPPFCFARISLPTVRFGS